MVDATKRNVLWVVVPTAAAVFLLLLQLIGVLEPARPAPPRGTYDASAQGDRAAYLLLDGLGYKVAQSRYLTGGTVRWIIDPMIVETESDDTSPPVLSRRGNSRRDDEASASLLEWIREGGTLLLADSRPEFARNLGLTLLSRPDGRTTVPIVDGTRRLELAVDPLEVVCRESADRDWPDDDDEPLASIYRRGRGEIWVVHHPEIFRNQRIRDRDNSLAICRLADLTSRNGAKRIEFDEYFHGMRERPTAADLLLKPPVVWVTLQSAGLLLMLLWRFTPRFGPLLESPSSRRRSKEEFLDAMAFLLARKAAYEDAYETMREAFFRDLERELGVAAGSPAAELAEAAAGRWPSIDPQAMTRDLSKKPPASRDQFLTAAHELERIRGECFS